MSCLGRGLEGPLPVRSMYFLRSVVQYSNTCKTTMRTLVTLHGDCAGTKKALLDFSTSHQIKHRFTVLLNVFNTEQPAVHG